MYGRQEGQLCQHTARSIFLISEMGFFQRVILTSILHLMAQLAILSHQAWQHKLINDLTYSNI